jgi:co-chaperonin GroES (HSP10)
MKNTSGIHPCGDRVLIKPDEIEEVTEGGIIIPGSVGELHAMAQSIGTFIACGPDAYKDHVERDSEGRITATRGFTKAFASPGDRVAFAKYGGLQVTGKDEKSYRIMNDVDVTAIVEEGVNFTDLKARTSFHASRK